MTDNLLKDMLSGVLNLKKLHTFIYGKNEMGEESLDLILKLLPQLSEFRLQQVKSNPNIINLIIYDIFKRRLKIKKLGLSNHFY